MVLANFLLVATFAYNGKIREHTLTYDYPTVQMCELGKKRLEQLKPKKGISVYWKCQEVRIFD